jgi:hypothetical protein
MSPTWEEWKLPTEAGALGRETEPPTRFDPLQAFAPWGALNMPATPLGCASDGCCGERRWA